MPGDLLGRHVPRGTEHDALREPCVGILADDDAGELGVEALGEAPVGDVDHAERAEQDVLGLQVTVDEAVCVSVGDGQADPGEDVEEALQRPRDEGVDVAVAHGAQDVVQVAAADALHGVEPAPVVERARIVDRDDARVLEDAGRAGFVDEPLHHVGACVERLAQHLQRDVPAKYAVFGEPHLTHPARTEPFAETIAVEAGQRPPLFDLRHAALPLRRDRGAVRRGRRQRLGGSACLIFANQLRQKRRGAVDITRCIEHRETTDRGSRQCAVADELGECFRVRGP